MGVPVVTASSEASLSIALNQRLRGTVRKELYNAWYLVNSLLSLSMIYLHDAQRSEITSTGRSRRFRTCLLAVQITSTAWFNTDHLEPQVSIRGSVVLSDAPSDDAGDGEQNVTGASALVQS